MLKKKRITIKEVAEAAGVSTQTVSRVVNNHPDVSPETLQRVQQIIKETGYAPNVLARSLIQGRSYTLGVVAYGLDYFGPSRILTGIEQQAAEMGYSIFLNLIHQAETRDVDSLLESMTARQVDGLIWAVPEIGHNRAWVEAFNSGFNVPAIFVSGMEKQAPLPLVGIDNQAIGRLATEHLLAGGAQKVGIISGPLNWWEAQQRQQGWHDTLEAHGLSTDSRLTVAGDWQARSGEQGLYQLLAQAPHIDAVFASNDQMALGALHAAHRLGRRVPQDLSIVGVDNTPESAHFWPPLTSVRQRLREAGALVVQEIDQLILKSKQVGYTHETSAPKVTWLKPELIVRQSTHPTP